MITHLSRLGFSVSYQQVRSYKKAVTECRSLTPIIPRGSFVQWTADNVDHNCRTLDGKNTFHGMGIVASVTPHLIDQGVAIERTTLTKNLKEITSSKNIPIIEYIGKALHPTPLKFKPRSSVREAASLKKDTYSDLDFAWISNWIAPPTGPLGCNWAGYMQRTYSNETNYQKS